MQDSEELGSPDKADKRAEPCTGWTLAELNGILQDHVVDGALTTFGCVENLWNGVRSFSGAPCVPGRVLSL